MLLFKTHTPYRIGLLEPCSALLLELIRAIRAHGGKQEGGVAPARAGTTLENEGLPFNVDSRDQKIC